jgi:hypothetical protein
VGSVAADEYHRPLLRSPVRAFVTLPSAVTVVVVVIGVPR